jgi:2-iminobutanoate/2-iminopropanoate deaminase
MVKQFVRTSNAPQPSGSYSQGIKVGNLLFVAGQGPADPKTGKLPGTDIETQTRQTLQNIKGIVEAAGLSMQDVVKVTVYLRSANDFSKMDAVYRTFFPENPPTRMTLEAGLPLASALIAIDAIACT